MAVTQLDAAARAAMIQRRANQKILELVTAPRTDIYGNTISYDPQTGFSYDLDPFTKLLTDLEQGRTLQANNDAALNRGTVLDAIARAGTASSGLDTLVAQLTQGNPKSQDAYVADAQQEQLRAQKEGLDSAGAEVNRALLRQGRGSETASTIKSLGEQYASSIGDALTRGRDIGRASYAQDQGTRINDLGTRGQILQQVASYSTPPVPTTPAGKSGDALVQQAIAMVAQILRDNAAVNAQLAQAGQ